MRPSVRLVGSHGTIAPESRAMCTREGAIGRLGRPVSADPARGMNDPDALERGDAALRGNSNDPGGIVLVARGMRLSKLSRWTAFMVNAASS